MHTGFGLEPAVGVVALHLDGRRFDSGALAQRLIKQRDLVAMLLGPARVHAKQHAGPVLALSAAGASMNFEIGLEGVGFAGKQRLKLAAGGLGFKALERRFGFIDDALILL